jgi:hypothetical protein
MDTDDISLPQRFEKQIDFMMNHPDVAVSSAMIEEIYPAMEVFGDSEPAFKYKSIRKIPLTHTEILKFAKYRSPVSHPVSVFYKRTVLAMGGYPVFMKAQDYALWSLMLKNNYQFANVDEVLLKMRCGDNLMRKRDIIHFKQEFNVLKYQRKIGFIDNYEFARNAIMRFGIRVAPNFIKKIIYGFVRQHS